MKNSTPSPISSNANSVHIAIYVQKVRYNTKLFVILNLIQDPKAMNQYYIYIMSNRKNGVLYIGVTNNLIRRVFEHREHQAKGFTDKYNLTRIVYYEVASDITSAITREKQLKAWRRQWKIDLINKANPDWSDLYGGII